MERGRSNRKVTKSTYVYDVIMQRIADGHLAPGAALDRSALAAELNVSRQPLDSAIDLLANDGFVDVFPQHGSFVARIDATKVRDRFLVRRALEAEIAHEAVEHVTDAWLSDLRMNLRFQVVALESGSLGALFRHDIEFHAMIHALRPSHEALEILRRHETYNGWVRRHLLPAPGRARQTIEEHQAIWDALAARDGDAAACAMRRHLLNSEHQFRDGSERAV